MDCRKPARPQGPRGRLPRGFLAEGTNHRERLRNRSLVLAGALVLAVYATPEDSYERMRSERDSASGLPASVTTAPFDLELPPDLPPAVRAPEQPSGSGSTEFGIPRTVLRAYQRAESERALGDPDCHLRWSLLAGIGRVESHHARSGDVTADGDMRTPIYGPELDGTGGTMAIRDGARWARAAGPMQFIPSTWANWGADGSGDGRVDPQNVYDAAVAAGRYLCADGSDLSTEHGMRRAVLRYNHSDEYARTVLAWARAYERGGRPEPDRPGSTAAAELIAVTSPAPVTEPAHAPIPEQPEPAPPQDNGGSTPPPPPPGTAAPPEDPALIPLVRPIVDVVNGAVPGLTGPLRDLAPTPAPRPAKTDRAPALLDEE
ncbi:transglycosylase protein with SLT domain [Saccharopolyspora erythraea NRRL 2338]|uniref:Lytic murein transglycosylase n=1 Tax=Saccharopolyspora erythraea TaxID=1836 RepID=A0ABP3N2M3_SACER|nr:transglycosylase protein with SLT domain [Saccharopolyspora erythraea NRRL 2338]